MRTLLIIIVLLLGIVAVVVETVLAADRSIEGRPWRRHAIAAAVLFIAFMWFIITAYDGGEEQGPCVREETGFAYNPATKTTQPYTYCAERGTWVNQ